MTTMTAPTNLQEVQPYYRLSSPTCRFLHDGYETVIKTIESFFDDEIYYLKHKPRKNKYKLIISLDDGERLEIVFQFFKQNEYILLELNRLSGEAFKYYEIMDSLQNKLYHNLLRSGIVLEKMIRLFKEDDYVPYEPVSPRLAHQLHDWDNENSIDIEIVVKEFSMIMRCMRSVYIDSKAQALLEICNFISLYTLPGNILLELLVEISNVCRIDIFNVRETSLQVISNILIKYPLLDEPIYNNIIKILSKFDSSDASNIPLIRKYYRILDLSSEKLLEIDYDAIIACLEKYSGCDDKYVKMHLQNIKEVVPFHDGRSKL